MKRLLLIVFSVLGLLLIVGCSNAEKELTPSAEYENCVLELTDAVFTAANNGKAILKVNAVYTNNGSEPLYALCSFSVKAFQNNTALTDCSDINGEERALIQEVKNGQHTNVTYVFELTGDSDIEVFIGAPTANQETLGKQTYSCANE